MTLAKIYMPATNTWQAQKEAKQKLLEPLVKRAIARVRLAVGSRSPKIPDSVYYGAIGIDPKHLVIWYIFKTTADKISAEANGLARDLDPMSRDALRVEGYSEPAIVLIHISVASNEEIMRGGGWDFFR